MLKQKLKSKSTKISPRKLIETSTRESRNDAVMNGSSPYFKTPIWMQFFCLEQELNENIKREKPTSNITHTYNPIEYAQEIHLEYLKKYMTGLKHVMFVGMNPGPNGMGQTGVPFGNISTVRDEMHLFGALKNLPGQHSKRPIKGLECRTEEPSGVRIWSVLKQLSYNSLDVFSQKCFVHNFCPLAFFDNLGRNITPNELKPPYKSFIRDICLQTLEDIFLLVQPQIIIGVGDYIYQSLKKSEYCKTRSILKLPHPSPRSLNNTNWPEKAEIFFKENDLLKYFRNEV